MTAIHNQEKEQFKKLFRQDHIDRFEDRFMILETFLQTENHLSLDEIRSLLEEKGISYTPAFVRDTMKLLCRYGFAQKNRFAEGVIRYEHRHLAQHHDHMICTKCRRIIEFRNEQMESLQQRVAVAHGFHMLQHKMEIYGICPDCMKERIQFMPLTMAKPGEKLRISDFLGGATARMRLMTMGLRVGDRLEVITNNRQGEIAVAVDFKRYAIGRGLAEKIMVEPELGEP
jgi:Fur family ferric uptake transcriptional regulator